MKTSAKIGIKNHTSIAVNTVLAGCEMEWPNIGCGRLKPALLNLFPHFFANCFASGVPGAQQRR